MPVNKKWLRKAATLFVVAVPAAAAFLLVGISASAQSMSAITNDDHTAASWYNSGWSARRQMVVNNTSNSTTLTNYASPIALTASNFDFTTAKSDGSDIRVTLPDGVTLVPYWLQTTTTIGSYLPWSQAGQTGTIWVNLPTIPGSKATANVYVYYGNASPTPFQIPPIGNWVKYNPGSGAGYPVINLESSNVAVMPENIVYDTQTAKYWTPITYDPTGGGTGSVYLASAASILGTWTLQGSASISPGNDPNGPHLMNNGTNWYIWCTVGTAYGSDNIHMWQGPLVSNAGGPVGTYTDQGAVLSCGTSGQIDSGRVAEPYIFQLQNAHGSFAAGTWIMLFMADSGTSGNPYETISFASASSLTSTTWTKFGSALVTQGATNTWYWCGGNGTDVAGDPYAVEVGNEIYIFFSTSRESNAFTGGAINVIGWLTTSDLANFTVGNVSLGPDAAWSLGGVFRGAISLFNNTYYATYCAVGNNNNFNTFQFGLASMSAQSAASGYPPDQVFGFFENFANLTNAHLFTYQELGSGGSIGATSNVLTLSSGTGSGGALYTLFGVPQFGPGYMVESYAGVNNASTNNQGAVDFIGYPDEWSSGSNMRYVLIGNDAYQTDNYWQQWVQNSSAAQAFLDMTQTYDSSYHRFREWWQSSSAVQGEIDTNAFQTLTSSDIPNGTMAPSLGVYQAASGSATTMNAQYFLVRPYSSPEPTTTLGARQSR